MTSRSDKNHNKDELVYCIENIIGKGNVKNRFNIADRLVNKKIKNIYYFYF